MHAKAKRWINDAIDQTAPACAVSDFRASAYSSVAAVSQAHPLFAKSGPWIVHRNAMSESSIRNLGVEVYDALILSMSALAQIADAHKTSTHDRLAPFASVDLRPSSGGSREIFHRQLPDREEVRTFER